MTQPFISFISEPGVFLTGVLALGGLAQWIAWRFRFPSILLLLAFGFAARQITGVDPASVLGEELLFALVSLFVAVILFEGGLSLKLVEVKESKSIIAKLVTVGVFVTWVLASLGGCYLLGMDWRVAALVGAVLTVTGPTVVGPLLRHIRPSRNVASITKWEGIVVDPVGALLAVLVFEALFALGGHGEELASGTAVVLILLKTLAVGGIVAFGCAQGLVYGLKRYLIPDYLHNFIFLAVAVGSFTVSNAISHESGLVTVTLLGILLANQSAFPVKHVLEFKESLRDLLISTLFIVLSARIELSQILDLGWGGLGFVALLIAVVRPLSVYASCVGSKLSWQERTFLAFLAPRGIVAAAVASVFAAELLHRGTALPGSESIVPLTFLVIVGTVTTYGLFSPLLARILGLAAPNPQGILFAGASSSVRKIAKSVHEEGIRVLLVDTNFQNVSAARQEGLPAVSASVLSEFVDEEVDLGGLGRMLAMTPNDDLNRLASLEFAADFGRANVYQLKPRQDAAGERRNTSKAHIEGRFLFQGVLDFERLENLIEDGATLKKTNITEAFTYEDYLYRYGLTASILFVITGSGELQVVAAELVQPKPGDIVVSLVTVAQKEPSTTTEMSRSVELPREAPVRLQFRHELEPSLVSSE